MISSTNFNVTPLSDSTDQTKDASATNDLANKEVFLQLFVAQLKNQNPLNPADGIEFITQLSQFSQLEQTMESKQELVAIHKLLSDAATTQSKTDTADTSQP